MEAAALHRVEADESRGAAVDEAVRLLRAGALAVLPTDTGYALCGRATDERVLERVVASKGRDPAKPLHVLVASVEAARELVELEPRVERALRRLLPGPLTFVLPARESAPRGLNRLGATLGIRVPALPFTLGVLAALGAPLTATSANPSGGRPPFDSEDLEACRRLPGVEAVFDAGPVPWRRASTIVEILPGQQPVLIRPGPVELSEVQVVLGIEGAR